MLRYGGRWRVASLTATALGGARLALDFRARRVFLVLGSPGAPRQVHVLLDGRPIPSAISGADVRNATATIDFQRLYRLVNLARVERHVLTLDFASGVRAYAFTFG
jgi:hypothetical protein